LRGIDRVSDGAPRLLATSYSAPETAVIVSLLQSYGIAACALDGHSRVMPTMMLALGGNRIFVPEGDYEDARQIIGESGPAEATGKPLSKDGPGNVLVTLGLALLIGLVPPPRIAMETED